MMERLSFDMRYVDVRVNDISVQKMILPDTVYLNHKNIVHYVEILKDAVCKFKQKNEFSLGFILK